MNTSHYKKIIFAVGVVWAVTVYVQAQNKQWVNSLLPPGHLLETLPWLGDDGKVENNKLFDFVDLRGSGQKDLLMVYRQSVPAADLDKPHNQTLAVGFFDPKTQNYLKVLEDEGGTIQWVRLFKDSALKGPVLVFQRDDLKGHQALVGYVYENAGLKKVLDAQAPKVYAQFVSGLQGNRILASSSDVPKSASDADHVFSWDSGKIRFAEGKAPRGMAGWTGESIDVPTPTPAPIVKTASTPVVVASHPSANGWWDEPFDMAKSFEKLKNQLVPMHIKRNELALLGQKATAYFKELQKRGVVGKEFAAMRSGYYTAVASSLLGQNKPKDAAYYLKIALGFQADNVEALALKEKLSK